jgi:hypothetical protein
MRAATVISLNFFDQSGEYFSPFGIGGRLFMLDA